MPEFEPKVADISHYEEVNEDGFLKAKEDGIIGIIAKASQGTHYKDPEYNDFQEMARDAGLLFGAYHFNSGENVEQQVEWFLECANPDPQTLLALDYEANPRSDMSIRKAVDFLYLMEEKTKRKAVIYSGNKLKETIDGLNKADRDYVCSHKLWLAQYGARYRLPRGFKRFFLWQYTGDGFGPEPHWVKGIRCPGNKGLDLNVYDGSDDELRAEWAT